MAQIYRPLKARSMREQKRKMHRMAKWYASKGWDFHYVAFIGYDKPTAGLIVTKPDGDELARPITIDEG